MKRPSFLRRAPRPPRWPTLVAIGVVVFLLVLWLVPQWQVPDGLDAKERFDVENSARLTIAQIVGGVVLAGTLYLTWRRISQTERTIEIAQEGQITERFTRAVEQLGSDSLQIRLGGIYALERIARDSVRDHWPIMEVLTAFVRENARWDDANPPPPRDRPPADIQAILTVLGRRERGAEREGDRRLDLSGTDLRGVNLDRAHLERANLFGAHLEGASLYDAHLEGASLDGAHLEGANLREAHLDRAHLSRAHLERAELDEAHLEGASLYDAHLEGAYLDGAHLDGASFLVRARLDGASLSRAHLEEANLRGADLRGAIGLTQEQIDGARIDGDTLLPDDITRPGAPSEG